MHRWLSSREYGELAGISRQKAHAALRASYTGKPARGAHLIVQQVRGVGGRSGFVYEVRADSLPADLRERAACHDAARPLRHDNPANDLRAWWANELARLAAHPKRSAARAAAIADMAARTHVLPGGRRASFSERTIQRRLAAFEADGAAGLQKRARPDRGKRRVVISTRWDGAVPFDRPTRERIAAAVTEHVRELWRSGAVLTMVIRYGSEGLVRHTQEAGFDPDARRLRRICELPRRFVEPHKHLRQVHRYERDRKAHEDARPRIRRTRAGLVPMELVSGDVHHLDIYVRREDGRLATPKMLGWCDEATNRIYATFVLCNVNPDTGRSEGVRNEHVIASFISMTQHPEWGMPRALYLDNGAEYNFAPFIDDAMKLIADDGLRRVYDRASQVVHAKPYNAAGKGGIEGAFGNFERHYISQLPEWIAGDRMRAKTANVGRPPAPYPDAAHLLDEVLPALLALHETQPQRGTLTGRSPREAFARAVAKGWRRIDVDAMALRVAFSTEESRVVRQGSITVNGQWWTCPELQAYLGDRVTVLLPKYEDWGALPIKDDRGRWLGMAVPDRAFHPLDPEGAREAKRRSRRHEANVVEIGRRVQRRDLVGEAIASAASAPPAPPVESGGIVTLNADAAAMGRAIGETPRERLEREQGDWDREQQDILERQQRRLEALRRAESRKAG
jgi:hypothetical protein